jgi:pyruvate,water dikinase
MASAKAIIAERGSVLSHTAIVGRELGIATVVGARGACEIIAEGSIVTVNGSTGRVSWK